MLILTTLEQRKAAEEQSQHEQVALAIITEIREIVTLVKKMDDDKVQLNNFGKIMPKVALILQEVTDKDSPWAMYCLGEILETAARFPEQAFLESLRTKICDIFYCSPAKPFPQEILDQPIWREFGKPVRTLGYYWMKIQTALQEQAVIHIPESCQQKVAAKIAQTYVDNSVADELLLREGQPPSDGSGAEVVPITQRQDASAAG
jgi:hypothetical protein